MIHRADAIRFIAKLDAARVRRRVRRPAVRQGLATAVAERWLAVPSPTLLGIEHRSKEQLPATVTRAKYGTTSITFYRALSHAIPSP